MSPRKPKYTELTAQIAEIKAIRNDMALMFLNMSDTGPVRSADLFAIIKRIDAALAGNVGSTTQRAAASGDSHAS